MSSQGSESSQSFWLTVGQGPGAGSTHPLHGQTFTVGRTPDNSLTINDDMISRHHARFTWQGNGYILEDLGSVNGTYVNGARLTSPAPLSAGDAIGLGPDVVFTYGGQYAAGAAAATRVAAGGAAAAQPYYAPAAATETGQGRPGWVAVALAIILLAVAVAAVVMLWLVFRQPSEPDVAAATSTQSAMLTTAPTYTPYPTYTPPPTGSPLPTDQPTEPPTYTPYPTYTPPPTGAPTIQPTYTPYPTYTPIPTVQPTYTPYPTYTPPPTGAPTKKPTSKPKPPAPLPTNTSPAPAPAPAPYTITIVKVEPEPWGRPTAPDGCGGPYNDRDPVKRFTIEVALTNHSDRTIPDGWRPVFHAASGQIPTWCKWYYDQGDQTVSPGETTYVTFGTHTELSDWVSRMVFDELGYQTTTCFDAGGHVVGCP